MGAEPAPQHHCPGLLCATKAAINHLGAGNQLITLASKGFKLIPTASLQLELLHVLLPLPQSHTGRYFG
jgi:hypothetical protein